MHTYKHFCRSFKEPRHRSPKTSAAPAIDVFFGSANPSSLVPFTTRHLVGPSLCHIPSKVFLFFIGRTRTGFRNPRPLYRTLPADIRAFNQAPFMMLSIFYVIASGIDIMKKNPRILVNSNKLLHTLGLNLCIIDFIGSTVLNTQEWRAPSFFL